MSSKPREGRQPRLRWKKKRLCVDDEAVVGRTGEADQNGTDRTDPQHPPVRPAGRSRSRSGARGGGVRGSAGFTCPGLAWTACWRWSCCPRSSYCRRTPPPPASPASSPSPWGCRCPAVESGDPAARCAQICRAHKSERGVKKTGASETSARPFSNC